MFNMFIISYIPIRLNMKSVSYTHLLTHEHIDHVYALPSLLHHLWLGGRAKALDIYIPEGMEPLVNGLIDLFGICLLYTSRCV